MSNESFVKAKLHQYPLNLLKFACGVRRLRFAALFGLLDIRDLKRKLLELLLDPVDLGLGQMGQDVSNLAQGFGVPVPGVVDEAAGFLQNLFK